MPVYNEARTLQQAVDQVLLTGQVDELIIVDDGSHDDTPLLLAELENVPKIRLIRHSTNRGKGAALRTAFAHVNCDIVVIQDADLE